MLLKTFDSETVNFGDYSWRILQVESQRALMITETILEQRWYHEKFEDVTWADCVLRTYLNQKFYNTFKPSEKEDILEVTCKNPDNPWFGTEGGQDTVDKIFLLSLEEVSEYFGDSKATLQNKGKQTWSINDSHNSKRQAKYGDEFHWWRLRSPGYYSRTAASINKNGHIYVRGNGVYGRPKASGGIRPAMWIRIDDKAYTETG